MNAIGQRESVATAGTAFAGVQADWAWKYDALGLVVAADHANTPAAVRAYQFDSIGNRVKTASVNRCQYRFSTKPRDVNTGLYYYGYRWYDPVTGRWPSRDPIEERGGVNLYGFVGNDGVNGLDVLGLATVADVNRTIENLRRKYEDSDFVKATRFESALRKFRALAPSYTVVHLPPGQANDPGGQWDYNFNEMRLPHIISDDAVILHELTHAYNDINNTGLSKMDDEGMAHVMHYSLRQMDFLNAIERDVKTSSSCEELKGFVQGYWPMYWDTSSHYSDWGEKHWKDWSRRKFSDNLKQGDFVNVDNHLGANFSCSRLRDAMNNKIIPEVENRLQKSCCVRVACAQPVSGDKMEGTVRVKIVGTNKPILFEY